MLVDTMSIQNNQGTGDTAPVRSVNERMQLSPEEAQKVYEAEAEAAEKERQANSLYIRIRDGEQAMFTLSGVIYTELATFDDSKGAKRMFSFELVETNAKGDHKRFTASARSKVAGELLTAIKGNRRKIAIKRSGEGNKTTYMVLASTV